MHRHERGFTLASLSVALLIMGIMYYTVMNQNEPRRNALAYDTVVYSAVVVGKALQMYYSENCSSGAAIITPTVSDLIDDGYIPTESAVENRLDLNFTTQILNPGTSNSMIYVVANAPSISVAQQIIDQSNNASRTGSAVTFKFKPTMSASTKDIRVNQMNTYFGDTYCS